MSQDNNMDVVIPDDQHARIIGFIEGLLAELLPLLKTMTVEQRKELFKLGEKNISFLLKNVEYAQQHADMVPVFMDLPMMERDVNANERLTTYFRMLQPLNVALEDSIMLTGSEALQAAMSGLMSEQEMGEIP